MKILLISGDHIRHKNFASVIDSKFELVSWIVEGREDSIPKIYGFKNKIDKLNPQIPADHLGISKIADYLDISLEKLESEVNYELLESAIRDESNIPEKISFLRMDTDIYMTTKKQLEVLYPRYYQMNYV